MAISNFTKTLVRSVFPSSQFPARLLPTYKKLSYVDAHKKPREVVLSAENVAALSMLSREYLFKYADSRCEDSNPLGVRRVESVVINAQGGPEVYLSPHYDSFSLADLVVVHEVVRAV